MSTPTKKCPLYEKCKGYARERGQGAVYCSKKCARKILFAVFTPEGVKFYK